MTAGEKRRKIRSIVVIYSHGFTSCNKGDHYAMEDRLRSVKMNEERMRTSCP